ncbi:hypothetical protein [uncultured Aquimonas sp.]|uniref:hypothetical protein n=1 Tax=uncultured Aquimonas sp. TaxID=385483 RepID=UPI0026211018|nr:hypothetical protein [uncultured Aquimonas sp.]
MINAAEGSYLGAAVPLLEDGSPDPSFTVVGSRPLVDFNPRRVLVDALRLSTLQPRETPCVDRSRNPLCA